MQGVLGALSSGGSIGELHAELKEMNRLINLLAQEMRLTRLELKRQNDRGEGKS